VRRSKPTGADYVIAVAADQRHRNEYASAFTDMVTTAATGPMAEPMMVLEAIALRPLRLHEATPVAILNVAFNEAVKRRDRKAIEEIAMFGLALLAKWPDYLVALDMHPDFEHKSTGETEGSEP
jgi:hypothetical protein